ncbi:hypothetical protein UA70_29105, partial [Raoultella planticola]
IVNEIPAIIAFQAQGSLVVFSHCRFGTKDFSSSTTSLILQPAAQYGHTVITFFIMIIFLVRTKRRQRD